MTQSVIQREAKYFTTSMWGINQMGKEIDPANYDEKAYTIVKKRWINALRKHAGGFVDDIEDSECLPLESLNEATLKEIAQTFIL